MKTGTSNSTQKARMQLRHRVKLFCL